MRLNPVLEQLGAHPMAELHARKQALQARGARLIDFSLGDPTEPTPGFIRDTLREAVPEVSQYPTVAGLPELRAAIAGYLRRRFGVSVDPDTQVLPTSGAKESIFTTPLAFVAAGAGEVVVHPTPAYPIYERGSRFAGAGTVLAPLGPDFVLREELIPEDVWGRARLVWMCSPHNPAGSVMPASDQRELLDRCRSAGALLLSDECYTDLYEAEPPVSVLEVAGDTAAGVLTYLSCSKRSGMTGYRSGAVVGDAAAISALKRLRTSVGTASPEFVQRAAAAAWADDTHVSERRRVFATKRAIVRRAFDEVEMPVVGSTAGLYLWVAVGDDVAVTSRLLDGGVVVSAGRSFGPGGEGYIRLALVPTVEECENAVEVLVECLRTVS